MTELGESQFTGSLGGIAAAAQRIQAEPTRDRTPIEEAGSRLDEAVARCGHLTEKLLERIEPILVPEDNRLVAAERLTQGTVPLAMQLHQLADRVDQIADALGSAMNRLGI